jgi:transmembrane sensor
VSSGKAGNTGQEKLVEQAADWMARVTDPDASASDFRDWQEWLNADSAHAAAYQEIEHVWALTAHAKERQAEVESLPLPAADLRALTATAPVVDSTPRRRRYAVGLASAAAVAAVAIGLSVWLSSERHATYILETATAEQRSMQLADGSHVVVGAETKVSVDLTATQRSLTLDHGVAYFKVAPDKSRPFVVASDRYLAQAVGTEFSVDAQPGRMLVTVDEGVVRVSHVADADPASAKGSLVLVHAGQRVAVDDAGIRCSLAPNSSGSSPSWISGRLEYLHEELRYVIADVNRYSSRKIVLNDADIGRLEYTGTVLLEHVDEWVATLPGSFPVRVGAQNSGRFVLYAAGEQAADRVQRGGMDQQPNSPDGGC